MACALLCVGGLLAACVTEPATPDGLKRRKIVKTYTENGPQLAGSLLPEPEPVAYDPYAEEDRQDEVVFPPGLLPPTPALIPVRTQDPTASLSPYHQFSHQTIRAADGRLTRLYHVRAGSGAKLLMLIQAHVGGLGENDITIVPDFDLDPRPTNQQKGMLAPMLTDVEGGKVSDLLAVTATEDVLLRVDELLSALLTEVPQIEIEGKIVEISFDDGLETGSRLLLTEIAPHFGTTPEGAEDF